MIDLDDECYNNHISVVEQDLNGFNGAFINYKSTNIIALKSNLNANERTCVLCEELGHFYKGATYNINCTDINLIDKMEYKAKKYAFERLCPYEVIKELAQSYTIYEIADKLGVTDEFLYDAIKHYKEIMYEETQRW